MTKVSIAQKECVVNTKVLTIGIDVGKDFHVAVVKHADGRFSVPLRFSTNASGFNLFWDWLQQQYDCSICSRIVAGLESTGHYWQTFAHWLREKGVTVVQVNPLHTHKAKDLYDNSPSKTDAKDARIIADLASQGKFLRCIIPEGRYADLRYLAFMYKRLITERTRLMNSMHRVIDVLFPEFTTIFRNIQTKTCHYLLTHVPTPSLLVAFPYKGLMEVLRLVSRGHVREEKIAALYEAARTSVGIREGVAGLRLMLTHSLSRYTQIQEEWSHLYQLIEEVVETFEETIYLLSVKGVGVLTVAILLGETGGLGRYRSAEDVLKLAGLNLYECSSGKRRGRRRITRRGRSMLREALYLAAVGVVRRGGVLNDFYERLRSNGKQRAVALVAVACKLMRILFSLARDKRFYQLDYSPEPSVLGAC
jgi:transposase